MPFLPDLAPVSPGVDDLIINPVATNQICPASYRRVHVGAQGVLRLNGGVYHFDSLELDDGARLEANGPVEVRVATRFDARYDVYIGAANDVTLSARQLRIEVSGTDHVPPYFPYEAPPPDGAAGLDGGQNGGPGLDAGGDGGDAGSLDGGPDQGVAPDNGETPTVWIGGGSDVRALVLAPNGMLFLGDGVLARGAFFARQIGILENVHVTYEDGFTTVRPTSPHPCDDASECTTDACNGTSCDHVPVAAGTACSDGNPCHLTGACSVSGQCQAGADVNVDDGNPCTTDRCDPHNGVTHTPVLDGRPCEDGNVCNGTEFCNWQGHCGSIGNEPAGTSCADGSSCNGDEVCDGAGTCQAGTPPNRDDADPCTIDGCDDKGIFHVPTANCSPSVNQTPSINQFVLYSSNSTIVYLGTFVHGGDVGAQHTGPGQLMFDFRVRIEGAVLDTSHNVAGDTVYLGSGSQVGDVQTNRFYKPGGNHQRLSPLGAMPALPPVIAVAAGTAPSFVATGEVRQLSPGAFGDIQIAAGGTLQLRTGVFDVRSITVGDGARIEALGRVQLRVAQTLLTEDNGALYIGPAQSTTLTAADFRIEVSGASDNIWLPVFRAGQGSEVHALVLAPNGAILLYDQTVAVGAFLARDVGVAANATVTFQDGFVDPTVCEDNNPCTLDAFVNGACSHSPVAIGTSCSDGNVCNGIEACNANGACQAGTPLVQDDGNPCTDDACNPITGVSHVASAPATPCPNNTVCDGLETCDGAGACQPGTPLVTDDGRPCTDDSCDPVNGVAHVNTLSGTPRPDGNVCNGEETCDGNGNVLPGTPLVPDDGNVCTDDSCDAVTGVHHDPVQGSLSCSDGNVCHGVGQCYQGACEGMVPPVVDDGNPCTADSCDPSTGVHHVPLAAGTACSLHTSCQNESCDGTGGCGPHQVHYLRRLDDGMLFLDLGAFPEEPIDGTSLWIETPLGPISLVIKQYLSIRGIVQVAYAGAPEDLDPIFSATNWSEIVVSNGGGMTAFPVTEPAACYVNPAPVGIGSCAGCGNMPSVIFDEPRCRNLVNNYLQYCSVYADAAGGETPNDPCFSDQYDNSEYIQCLLDNAAVAKTLLGHVVTLPAGTYNIFKALIIPSNVTLRGNAAAKTKLLLQGLPVSCNTAADCPQEPSEGTVYTWANFYDCDQTSHTCRYHRGVPDVNGIKPEALRPKTPIVPPNYRACRTKYGPNVSIPGSPHYVPAAALYNRANPWFRVVLNDNGTTCTDAINPMPAAPDHDIFVSNLTIDCNSKNIWRDAFNNVKPQMADSGNAGCVSFDNAWGFQCFPNGSCTGVDIREAVIKNASIEDVELGGASPLGLWNFHIANTLLDNAGREGLGVIAARDGLVEHVQMHANGGGADFEPAGLWIYKNITFDDVQIYGLPTICPNGPNGACPGYYWESAGHPAWCDTDPVRANTTPDKFSCSKLTDIGIQLALDADPHYVETNKKLGPAMPTQPPDTHDHLLFNEVTIEGAWGGGVQITRAGFYNNIAFTHLHVRNTLQAAFSKSLGLPDLNLDPPQLRTDNTLMPRCQPAGQPCLKIDGDFKNVGYEPGVDSRTAINLISSQDQGWSIGPLSITQGPGWSNTHALWFSDGLGGTCQRFETAFFLDY